MVVPIEALLAARTIREPDALIAHPAGSEEMRPSAQTPIRGLFLCGEHVCTGLPANLESAARSAILDPTSAPNDGIVDNILVSGLRNISRSRGGTLTLVNDILDFNKMEAGKIVFEKTEFDLSSMIEDIRRSYSHRAREKNIEFTIEKPDELPASLIGDPIRLNQIISNLLSNAIKFTPEGGVTLKFALKEKKNNRAQLEFSVADTGIGIPRDKLDEVF